MKPARCPKCEHYVTMCVCTKMPTCFGSSPTAQQQAENECDSCSFEPACYNAGKASLSIHPDTDIGRARRAAGLSIDTKAGGVNKAIEMQAGGEHYKHHAIQPFHFVRRNKIPHAEGECIYRLVRWREKGGIDDLKKVIHTVQLIIEEEEANGTQGT